MTIEEILEKGAQAQTILENELFREIISAYEKRLIDQWKSTSLYEQSKREDLWKELTVLKKVLVEIQMFFQNAAQLTNEQE